MTFSTDLYLKRLGLNGPVPVTPEGLDILQKAHLRNIPYENCEIFFQKKVPSLDPEDLFQKIVIRKRGGYCFELNGLFACLLEKLGFRFTQTFARWHLGEADEVPPRRHRIMLVRFGKETWIADAGIGCPCPQSPLQLELNVIQARGGINYRIVQEPRLGFVIQQEGKDGWKNYYSFWDIPHFAQDFRYVNFFCALEESSFFRNHLSVNLPTPEGRRSLFDKTDESGTPGFVLQLEKADGTVESSRIALTDAAGLHEALQKHFGITF